MQQATDVQDAPDLTPGLTARADEDHRTDPGSVASTSTTSPASIGLGHTTAAAADSPPSRLTYAVASGRSQGQTM
jgi:hypothetical protein